MICLSKQLVKEIIELKKISVRKLALSIRVRPSTLCRIMSGYTQRGTIETYEKLLQYRKNIKVNQTSIEGYNE